MSLKARLGCLIFGLVIFLSSSFTCVAQDTTALIQRLHEMVMAIAEKDYGTFVDLSHPGLVEVMGGPESMLVIVTEEWEGLLSRGMGIDTIYFGTPRDFQRENNNYYAFVPQVLVMSIPHPGKKMLAVSYLMAVNGIEGEPWTFVDVTGLEGARFRYLFPDYNGKVPKPFVDKPIVVSEAEVEDQLRKIWVALGDQR